MKITRLTTLVVPPRWLFLKIETDEGITGWAIGGDGEAENGNDAGHLYHKLGEVVLPLWYGNRSRWTAVMKGAIGKNASFFNSHRMLRHYAIEAYLR